MADKAADKAPDPVATQPNQPAEVAGFAVTDPAILALMSPEARKSQEDLIKDWSEYVAVTDIPHGGVLAYAAGAPVPASNVKRWKYDELGFVAKRSSAAGKAAIEAHAPRTPSTVNAPGDG
jgi:hypothetical protein